MYAKNNNQRGFAGWVVKLVSLAVAASMTGCSLMHTPYETPAVQTPEQWQYRVQAPSMLQSNDRWWQLFNDEQLNALVELAFERNNDLAAAASKVRQAQLQAKLAGSDLLPTVTGRLNASGERSIDISEAWSKGSGTSLSVSYEADLWGRLSSLKNAADWEAMATEADREATALSLPERWLTCTGN